MGVPKCPICAHPMVKNGKTSAGKQRWKCRQCRLTKTHPINSDAKRLEEFLDWLLTRKRQADMPGQGRSFRRKTAKFWSIWCLPPLIDEIHRVVYVDGIHLGRKAVVLIACTDDYILGWYLARYEHSGAWANLLRRIAPPDMVVSDGGKGFQSALRQVWPQTELQRCTYHAYCQVVRNTTRNPQLEAGKQLLKIARDLLYVKTEEERIEWIGRFVDWNLEWDDFLKEKTRTADAEFFTHDRLRRAQSSLMNVFRSGNLFTYLDDYLTIGGELPATNNLIEGKVNAQLREMLRLHRGLSLTRRIKAIFWWCYLHTECPLGPADILKVMPTDDDIDRLYSNLNRNEQLCSDIPKWGDAVMWSDLHHIDPNHDAFRHNWD